MKKILFPLVLLICSIRLFSQDGGYDSFEHPMLKKLLGKAPAIIGFSEKEEDKWISIAVLDSNTRTLYLFTQTGLLHSELDVPDSVSNKLQARELSPFEFYKSVIQTDLALFDFAITKLRFPAIEYSIPGVNDFDKEIRDIIKETGGKTKRDKLRVLLQKRKVTQYDLATIDLKLTGDVPTDSTFKDLLYRKSQILQNGYYISAGTVKKEFYALNSLSTLFKAVLHEERKCLVFYEKDDRPYDSMRLNSLQLQQISKNKINVFSLYQDYVMRQLERADSVVWGLYVAARRSGKNEPFSAMAAYQPGAGNKKARAYQQQQQLLTRLHLTASSSSYRIRQYISYLQNTAQVYKVGKYDENSETLFIFTTTRVRRGRKQYELTDHRGNVMATISDKKVAVDTNGDGKVDHYAPDVVSATDYAPFGMALPGRNYGNEKYRYGYNGKENDNEVKGTGNQQDYGMRISDTRLGRFLSVDPLTKDYSFYSPYHYAGNSPIKNIDIDGLEPGGNQWDWDVLQTGKVYSVPHKNSSGKTVFARAEQQLVKDKAGWKGWITHFQWSDSYHGLTQTANAFSYYDADLSKDRDAKNWKGFDTDLMYRQKQMMSLATNTGIAIFGIAAGLSALPAFSAAAPALVQGTSTIVRTGWEAAKFAVKTYGRDFLYNTGTEIISNGGDISKIDWFDVGVSTINPLGRYKYGSVGTELITASTDFSGGSFQTVFNGSKSTSDAIVDVSIGAVRVSGKEVVKSFDGSGPASNYLIDVLTGYYQNKAKQWSSEKKKY